MGTQFLINLLKEEVKMDNEKAKAVASKEDRTVNFEVIETKDGLWRCSMYTGITLEILEGFKTEDEAIEKGFERRKGWTKAIEKWREKLIEEHFGKRKAN